MPEITGRLLAVLHPNGTVRMVFIARFGGGNECLITTKNLDTAVERQSDLAPIHPPDAMA
jgi:hypothetical protein